MSFQSRECCRCSVLILQTTSSSSSTAERYMAVPMLPSSGEIPSTETPVGTASIGSEPGSAGILPGRLGSASSVGSVLAIDKLTRLAASVRYVGLRCSVSVTSMRSSRASNRDCAALNRYSGYDPRNVCTDSSGLPTSSSRTPRPCKAASMSNPASVASWKSSTISSLGRSSISACVTVAAASTMSCDASRRYSPG